MNAFPDKMRLLDAGMHGGSRLFYTESDFRYHSSFGLVTVSAGFVTDGASIPRAFWSILSPFGDYFSPALIHDWLYSAASPYDFDRWESDIIFKEAMWNVGVPWYRRELIYCAVRLFGRSSFKPKTK